MSERHEARSVTLLTVVRGTTWDPDARNRAVKEAELLRGVAVVWMPVQDIERAKGFYRDILGLQITNEDGEWAEVDANGLTIGLNGREPSGAGSTGGPVVAFRSEGGLEETAGSLQEWGVEVPAGISEHPWGRVETFKDSDGNDLQLYEPPSG